MGAPGGIAICGFRALIVMSKSIEDTQRVAGYVNKVGHML